MARRSAGSHRPRPFMPPGGWNAIAVPAALCPPQARCHPCLGPGPILRRGHGRKVVVARRGRFLETDDRPWTPTWGRYRTGSFGLVFGQAAFGRAAWKSRHRSAGEFGAVSRACNGRDAKSERVQACHGAACLRASPQTSRADTSTVNSSLDARDWGEMEKSSSSSKGPSVYHRTIWQRLSPN